jgi:hypothetical protein
MACSTRFTGPVALLLLAGSLFYGSSRRSLSVFLRATSSRGCGSPRVAARLLFGTF